MPHHILAKEGDVAERVVITGDPRRVRKLAKLLDSPRCVNRNRGLLIYTGKYNGVDVSIATHGLGAPSTAIVIEELGHLGAKKFVRFGTAGTLAPNINAGDYVIASSASHTPGGIYAQYFGENSRNDADADPELTAQLVKAFSARALKYYKGKSFSSDALYAESPGFAKRSYDAGNIAAEMECALIYKLSKLRGWKSGSALIIVNNINESRGPRMSDRELGSRIIEGARAVLDGLSKA